MLRIVFCALMILSTAPVTAQSGRWLTQSGNLEIEIAVCGDVLCGTVVRQMANRSMASPGSEVVDTPSVLGKVIMWDFRPSGEGTWDGSIYNRENGKTYGCVMQLDGPDALMVRPYVFIPLFGQSQTWTRVVAGAPK